VLSQNVLLRILCLVCDISSILGDADI